MVKCHDEIISFPEIYFKMPADMMSDVTSKPTVRVLRNLAASSTQPESTFHLRNDQSDEMSEKHSHEKNLTADLSSVVHCGTLHLTTTESGQMQLSYPLLSSHTNLESEDITLGNVASQITCSNSVAQTIDVDSLLQDDVVSTGAIMLSKDSNADVLAASIHESVIRDCSEVVIIDKNTKSNEFNSGIDPSSAINIWMSGEGSVTDDPNNDERTNVLIVSEQTITEAAKTLPMLSSGIVSPVVETIMLNTPSSSDVV